MNWPAIHTPAALHFNGVEMAVSWRYTWAMNKPTAEELLPPGFAEAVLRLLEDHPQGIGEFALLRHLAGAFPDSVFAIPGALREPLQLFQLHFLLFHGLYRLSDALVDSRRELLIEALCIRLQPRQVAGPAVQLNDPLRSYYLDWNQWLETSADDVTRLLDDFWRSRHEPVTDAQVRWARDILGVTAEAGMATIKRCYRRLMMQHHPDRGGDTARGVEINEAYLILNRYYR